METPSGQIEGIAKEKWVVPPEGDGAGVVSRVVVHGDQQRGELERLQHYMSTTAPAKRCPFQKMVLLLKSSQHMV